MEKLLRNLVKQSAKLYYNVCLKNKEKSSYTSVSGKVLGIEELDNMVDASLDMWLTAGRFNDLFEKEFARYLGVNHSLTVNSGSSANLLAMSALTSHKLGDKRIQKGDEIITVAAGFPTTVNPIIQNGLIPVFVDCEIGTYNIDVSKIKEALSPKTRAIFIAHTLGNPFNLDKIKKICEDYNLWLIEDCCDALGADFNGQKIGTFGHISTFSFYPAHHITMGEGGAVVTNDSSLYKILISYRDWGRDCWCKTGMDDTCKRRFKQKLGNLPYGFDHKYTYSHTGYNLKITDWQASIALAQIKKLPVFLQKRKKNALYLTEKLSDLKDFFILPNFQNYVNPSWFGYLISVRKEAPFTKQEIVEYLENRGVGTRQLFAGNILRQPSFTDDNITLRIGSSDYILSSSLTDEHYKLLPNTDFIMNNTFWTGVYPALDERDMDKISELIHKFVNQRI